MSERLLIFFAAPKAVAVCGSSINFEFIFKFFIIVNVSSSLIFSAQKSFLIVLIES